MSGSPVAASKALEVSSLHEDSIRAPAEVTRRLERRSSTGRNVVDFAFDKGPGDLQVYKSKSTNLIALILCCD